MTRSCARRRATAERLASGSSGAARARRSGAGALSPRSRCRSPAELDLSAAVLRARRPDDRFSCLEQPDRDGFALAALGQAATIEARGPERFAEVAARARELGRSLCGRSRRGSGSAAGSRPGVRGRLRVRARRRLLARVVAACAPASLVLPEVALARQGGEARLTLNAVVQPRRRRRMRSWSGCARGRASSRPPRCRCSTRTPSSARAWRAPPRPRTTSRRSSARWSGSAPASSRRSCWRARCARTRPPRTTRRRCSGRCASCFRPATAGASARRRRRSSAPAPSCSCAATASAPRPSPSPAPRAAAPTRPSTTTSASSSSRARRTARSRRSWRAGSSGRSTP